MIPFIATAIRAYGSPEQYRRVFDLKCRERGFVPHTVSSPVRAYVNHNRWLIACECGAGNYADPTMATAYCLGCGAVHTSVVFPANVAALEAALIERPVPETRNWTTGETTVSLAAENVAHGIEADI